MFKINILLFTIILSSCSSFNKVTTSEQATVNDGSALIIFSLSSDNKFVIKNERSTNCIVKTECTRRAESHYEMRDGNNISSEYFFDIQDSLNVIKVSASSDGEYFIKYSPPALAYDWIESTNLYFSVPTAGKIYYLGNIDLSVENGQQVLDKKDTDITRLYKLYPQLREQPISDLKTWRNEKDKKNKSNLTSCTGNPTLGMSGGTAGVTGYSSRCHDIDKISLKKLKRHFDDDISSQSRKNAMKKVLEGPHEIDGLISFMPKGPGWFSVKSGPKKAAYAKKIKAHHTQAATAIRVYPPRTNFKSPEDFMQFVIPVVENSYNGLGDIIKIKHELNTTKSEYCVKSYVVMKISRDLAPEDYPELYYQVYKYTCRHPKYTDRIYQFSFSERSSAISELGDFSRLAKSYTDLITFTD